MKNAITRFVDKVTKLDAKLCKGDKISLAIHGDHILKCLPDIEEKDWSEVYFAICSHLDGLESQCGVDCRELHNSIVGYFTDLGWMIGAKPPFEKV